MVLRYLCMYQGFSDAATPFPGGDTGIGDGLLCTAALYR